MTLHDQLAAALADWRLSDCPREQLTGDVSPRHYHRLTLPDETTAVVMVTPLEKLNQFDDWLAIGDWLARQGLPVPRVLRVDRARGVLLIEDAGDCLLATVQDRERSDYWYRDTLTWLARLERASAGADAAASPAHARILNEERMHWELRRFRKVVAASVDYLDDDELAQWKTGEDAVVKALASSPRVWMHRDLHARNLLISPERAVWIDFQDAMMGPWLYDAASLLLDPYASIDDARRDELLGVYLAQSKAPREGFDAARQWALCATQRLVHCVACYVYVCEHAANSAYLRYLPAAIDRLRVAMGQCPEAAPLASIMAHRWPLLRERWCQHAVV